MCRRLFLYGMIISAVLSLASCQRDSDHQVVLRPVNRPALFVLYSKALQPIFLNHHRQPNPGVNAGWGMRLLPRHYALLMLADKKFSLSCKPLTCSKALKIQQLDAPVKSKQKYSYWVVENKRCSALKSLARQRGITVRFRCYTP